MNTIGRMAKTYKNHINLFRWNQIKFVIIERYITDFLYFYIRIGATLSKTKRRYAYLLLKNAGNIQFEYKDSIVIFTFSVG